MDQWTVLELSAHVAGRDHGFRASHPASPPTAGPGTGPTSRPPPGTTGGSRFVSGGNDRCHPFVRTTTSTGTLTKAARPITSATAPGARAPAAGKSCLQACAGSAEQRGGFQEGLEDAIGEGDAHQDPAQSESCTAHVSSPSRGPEWRARCRPARGNGGYPKQEY